MRKPTVENKYNLTIADVKELKVGDRSQIKKPLFWRNNAINAWCITESVGKFQDDSYWIGIYDEDAPTHSGKFRFYFTAYSDMCSYNFTEFFNIEEIENEFDLKIQELFLDKINYLIDLGILYR